MFNVYLRQGSWKFLKILFIELWSSRMIIEIYGLKVKVRHLNPHEFHENRNYVRQNQLKFRSNRVAIFQIQSWKIIQQATRFLGEGQI